MFNELLNYTISHPYTASHFGAIHHDDATFLTTTRIDGRSTRRNIRNSVAKTNTAEVLPISSRQVVAGGNGRGGFQRGIEENTICCGGADNSLRCGKHDCREKGIEKEARKRLFWNVRGTRLHEAVILIPRRIGSIG